MTFALKVRNHLFCGMFVLTNEKVNVIRQDCASVASVFAGGHDIRECIADAANHFRGESDYRKAKLVGGGFVEGADGVGGGLDLLAALVEFAEVFENVVADEVGGASSRIGWEPPTVTCPDQVIGDDEGVH